MNDRVKTFGISIIVPIYNAGNYLDECLHSITKQSYELLEIILVNDGSTDNSLEICNFHIPFSSNFRIFLCGIFHPLLL